MRVLVTSAAAILIAAIAATAAANPDEPRREIEAANRAMAAALGRGDLTAVARFYADDARIMRPRDTPVTGRKAIDAYWTAASLTASSRSTSICTCRPRRADIYVTGRNGVVLHGKRSPHVRGRGRAT